MEENNPQAFAKQSKLSSPEPTDSFPHSRVIGFLNKLDSLPIMRSVDAKNRGLVVVIFVLVVSCVLSGVLLRLVALTAGWRPSPSESEFVEKLKSRSDASSTPLTKDEFERLLKIRRNAVEREPHGGFDGAFQRLTNRIDSLLSADLQLYKTRLNLDVKQLSLEELSSLEGFSEKEKLVAEGDSIINDIEAINLLFKAKEQSIEFQKLRLEVERANNKGDSITTSELKSLETELKIYFSSAEFASEAKRLVKVVESLMEKARRYEEEALLRRKAGDPPKGNSDFGYLAVREYLIDNLNDYGSSEFLAWSSSPTLEFRGGNYYWVVAMRLRAKNAFGAYIIKQPIFYIQNEKVVFVEGF